MFCYIRSTLLTVAYCIRTSYTLLVYCYPCLVGCFAYMHWLSFSCLSYTIDVYVIPFSLSFLCLLSLYCINSIII